MKKNEGMRYRLKNIMSLLMLALVLSGCGAGNRPSGSAATPLATNGNNVSASPGVPRRTAPAARALRVGQSFAIDQHAQSDQPALKNVALVIHSATVTTGSLVLRIAFQNTSNTTYSVSGGFGGEDAVLVDENGRQYNPTNVSANLRSLAPADGFGPGTANVGDVAFPMPSGSGPYELHMPSYAPIHFGLDTLLSESHAPLGQGNYAIQQTLHSQEPALAPIELQVRSLEVMSSVAVFSVAFVNTGRQGYTLTVGPDGSDARLVDSEGQQYEPTSVSDSLQTSIAPAGGWQPGQANAGTLTFPLPTASETLRLVFPTYNAVSMRFDANGLVAATITSPSGGTPAPTSQPSAADAAYTALSRLLSQQAMAVESGDSDAYVATFDPALRDEQRRVAERLKQVPFVSYTLRLAPDAHMNNPESGTIEDVPVEISYTLRGIKSDNSFLNHAHFSFARDGTTWRVTRSNFDDTPPFWRLGDFVLRETPHFLIFARPETQSDLPELEHETERAYTTLQQRGLTLEPRYVAYFTNTADEFTRLTGRDSSNYLGLALSRYEFNGAAITATSRAFYINGAAFRANANRISPTERQTTITHELVHLALAVSTRPFTPPWLAEGIAVFYSEDNGAAQRQQLANSGQLDDMSLIDLTKAGTLGEADYSEQRIGAEYMFSGATVEYLVQTFGEETVLDFYRSYAAVPAADVRAKLPQLGSSLPSDAAFANLSSDLTAQAVQQFFGLSIAQLDADVKAWVQQP
jgi:hypothetical protein